MTCPRLKKSESQKRYWAKDVDIETLANILLPISGEGNDLCTI